MNARASLSVLTLVLSPLTLAGCGKKDTPPAPIESAGPVLSASAPTPKALVVDSVSGGGGTSQVSIGGGSEKGGRVTFEITAVHEKVGRSNTAPWWKGAGEWTFFDAKTDDGATMTIGLKETRRLQSEPPMTLLDGLLVTKDNAEGERLVASLSKGLGVEAPPIVTHKKPPAPLEASVVNLSEDARRSPEGSFSGKGGGWVAAKWTFENPGHGSGEIYVNYSLEAKKGELARKSAHYDASVVGFIARALRDGTPIVAAPVPSASAAAPKKP